MFKAGQGLNGYHSLRTALKQQPDGHGDEAINAGGYLEFSMCCGVEREGRVVGALLLSTHESRQRRAVPSGTGSLLQAIFLLSEHGG